MRRTTGALVLDAVRHHLPLLLAVALGITAGVALVVASVPSRYDATAIVGFSPRPLEPVGGDVVSLLVPGYAAAATARDVLDAAEAGSGVPAGTLTADDVAAEVVPGTATVQLVVSDAEPARAAALADALADSLVAQAGPGLLEARVVRAAQPPESPAAPARALFGLAGAIAGLATALALVIALEAARPRVRTADGLSSLLRAPTLGTVRRRTSGSPDPQDLLLGRLRLEGAARSGHGSRGAGHDVSRVAVLGHGCDQAITDAVAASLAASLAAVARPPVPSEDDQDDDRGGGPGRDGASGVALALPERAPGVQVVSVTAGPGRSALEAAHALGLVVVVVRRGERAATVQRLRTDLRTVGVELVGGVLVR